MKYDYIDKIYVVFGLKKSGHHGVIEWIRRSMNSTVVFYNNIKPIADNFHDSCLNYMVDNEKFTPCITLAWQKIKKEGYTEKQKLQRKKANEKWRKKHWHKIRDKVVKRNRELVLKHKQKLVNYLGGKCSVCGYDKCLGALHFHHKNEKEKEFGISNYLLCNLKMLKKEADKCILICANCHRELHAEEK